MNSEKVKEIKEKLQEEIFIATRLDDKLRRVETARKILQTLYNYPHEWHEMKIKELAKEYGVEVEE